MDIKERILLVEDDINFGSVLKSYLELNDYDVVLKTDGASGYSTFKNEKFDLCILDVNMPNMDGFSLASEIKKINNTVPFIFLTAKTLKKDMMEGYQLGAEDYITKPFDTDILLYKIKAIIKRKVSNSVKEDITNEFRIGKYLFNYKLRIIYSDNNEQSLSPKEAELLKLLCLNINSVLLREQALIKIWGEENYFTTRSMDVYITKLRKYLKDDESVEIINIHGNGFRLLVR